MKRGAWAAAVLTVLAGLAWAVHGADQPAADGPPAASGKVLLDEWRAMYMGGQKVGFEHMVTRELDTANGAFFVTAMESKVSITRAGVLLEVASNWAVREDAQGRVVAFQSESSLMQPTQGVLDGDHFTVTTTGSTGATSRQMPPPKGLGPWAAELFSRHKGYEPGTGYSVDAFLPETPDKPVTLTVLVGARESVQVFDVQKWLHVQAVSNSLLPGVPSKQWVDDEGTAWLTRTELTPQMQVETRKTTREFALSASEPAELLTASYITPDRPIERPRELEGLQALLTPVEAGGTVPELPQDALQKVSATEHGVLVTIARAHAPQSGYTLPYRDKEYADLLRANKWLEVDDPLIQQMAREAVGDATDAASAARRIESYVDKKITTKGLGVGMATAAETARQLSGDCSEHAMLAAALARAAGMPSRVVGGLAYVERLPGTGRYGFGYHMWAEVYVGQWLPIDATLRGHDATHIVLFRSDMNAPGAEITMASTIIQSLGRINIRVVQTTY